MSIYGEEREQLAQLISDINRAVSALEKVRNQLEESHRTAMALEGVRLIE